MSTAPNLVDSCGWLEYFANGANADFFAPAIEDTDRPSPVTSSTTRSQLSALLDRH